VILRLTRYRLTDQDPMPKKFANRKSVALLIETSNHYGREMLLGIRSFMSRQGDWAVHLTEQGRGARPPRWLARWRGDGVIARIENKSIEAAVLAKEVPTVNVSATGLAPGLHTFISDSDAVAKMAADHLVERGFEHYGYFGDSRFNWSRTHGEHFEKWIKRAGFTCSTFPANSRDAGDWEREQRRIANWIQTLPRPVGIMVNYDIRGQQLLDVCRHMGVRVPDEVAVIGQHNDELLCELCEPPLTSVMPNPQQAGFQAAAMLDRLMTGRQIKARTHRIPPVGVATRQSTDIVAVEDPRIAAAVRFIRDHACDGIDVGDVLKHVPMSRTLLERKFRTLLRRSPLEEIARHRLNRTRELLATTTLSIAVIAERAGYSSAEYLSAVFKKQTGRSPAHYRAAMIGN
jgi:LacI family transcriptional regulator